MMLRSVLFCAALLAAACFLTGHEPAVAPPVRSIDPEGKDGLCPDIAHVELPPRDGLSPLAPLHDLAYAAADAGPVGCLWLLGGVVFLSLLSGLWSHGLRGALRRVVLAVALGGPVGLALLYTSCLLPGRTIVLEPAAALERVPASLHNHTDRSTGILSPRQLVRWHAERGFRVLNVTDKNSIEGGLRAQEAVAGLGQLTPPLLVLVGDEWHGQPDLCFLNVTRDHGAKRLQPRAGASLEERREHRLCTVREVALAVHAEGGMLWVAHPWSKVPTELLLEDILAQNVDGAEIVNGVVHGGSARIDRIVGRTLFGVLDYKYGPHVTAMTLLDARLASTPAGVVEALTHPVEGKVLVVYAVPGGAQSDESYRASAIGLRAAVAALSSLKEVPYRRRGVWFAWGLVLLLLWWLGTRDKEGAPPKVMGAGIARALFAACALAEVSLLLFTWSEVRARVGTIPVVALVCAAAVLAIPLLAASHSLAVRERTR